ncbi:hypothetical protein H6G04_23320 [Calothrix membranacea FACHB-236]|nr:hypothetical protein [Calothrix membranacea FACHB-236]
MKISKELIIKQIYEDWGDSLQSEICVKLLDYLTQLPIDKQYHITFGSLKMVIGNKYTNIDLLKSVQYLCGDRTKLLDINFELLEDEVFFKLSNSDVIDAKKTGELVHPETGDIVDDFEEKVFMYFVPSSLIKKLYEAVI